MGVFSSRGLTHRQSKAEISGGGSRHLVATPARYRSRSLSMLGALLIGVVVPIGGIVLTAGPASAATLTVCASGCAYTTIQAAVTAAASGDTITVASGTYNENVTINKPLTLDGAQVGVDARGRTSASGSVIDGSGTTPTPLTVNASNVTIDGFTLDGPVSQGSAAIVMMGSNSGETIQNNIINDPGRAVSYNSSDTVFSQNVINETTSTGDGIQQNSGTVNNVTIENNNFSGGSNNNADITIISTATGSSNIIVSGNDSTDPSTLVALFNTSNAVISDNNVTGATGSAIYIGGEVSDISVSGNTITGGTASAIKVANAFGDGPNSGITIFGNTLNNNAYGINVTASSISNTVTARQNSLVGDTTYGVTNASNSGGSVNATNNWWGSSSGPYNASTNASGTGSPVSANVTYNPWLRGRCQPSFGTAHSQSRESHRASQCAIMHRWGR